MSEKTKFEYLPFERVINLMVNQILNKKLDDEEI